MSQKRTHEQQGAGNRAPQKQQQQEQTTRPPERDMLTQRAPGTSTEPKGPKQLGEGDRGEQVQQHGAASPNPDGEFGEGNYAASRDYNERTKEFIDSGRVDEAAHQAAPRDPREAHEMLDAEREGRSRAKEEDPEVSQAPKPGRGPDE